MVAKNVLGANLAGLVFYDGAHHPQAGFHRQQRVIGEVAAVASDRSRCLPSTWNLTVYGLRRFLPLTITDTDSGS